MLLNLADVLLVFLEPAAGQLWSQCSQVLLHTCVSCADPADRSAHSWIRTRQTSALSAQWETGWKPLRWTDTETTSQQLATFPWTLWPGCPSSE